MLKLILGRSGTGKSTRVFSGIPDRGTQRPQVLLVPDQSSHEAERALCRLTENKVSLYAEVLTFNRLANRVFMETGGLGVTELDGGGRILLMHQAVKGVESLLTVCRRSMERPAFLESLLATADELKSNCVPPDTLGVIAEEQDGPVGDKLRDLSYICGMYDTLLAQQDKLDPKDRLSRVAEKLKDHPWAEGKDIWVDGFADFTPQQLQILALLMEQGEQVTVALTCEGCGTVTEETELFAAAQSTACQLARLAKQRGIACEWEILPALPQARVPALEHLEQNLFSYRSEQPVPADGAIELFQAHSPRAEVEWTAARILQLVREGGYSFRDIGVVARNFEAYGDLIESVFSRYGVPVFCSGMHDILEKPVLSLVVGALDCLENDYAYEDVFRFLKTGLTDLEQEERDELENYVLKWNIRGSMWKKDWTMHPGGYGYTIEEADKATLERLNKMRRQVISPLEKLGEKKEDTGYNWSVRLYEFMNDAGMPAKLGWRMEVLRERGELALAEEYRQLWEILCGGLEQCAHALTDQTMNLSQFAGIFRLVLSQYDVGSIPVSLDRVTAGEMTRQKNHRVKVLFLLGAEDTAIPQISGEASLLTDQDWELISDRTPTAISGRSFQLSREMTAVYETCALPGEKLILTWPDLGSGGEEKRPCFVVERLKLLFSDLKVIREDALYGAFRLEAPMPALEQAGSQRWLRDTLSRLPEFRERVDRLEQAEGWERGRLSRQSVEKLYGTHVPMSASRMDRYRSCHFGYFMEYGLKAKPRKPAGFTAPEYGTFVHFVLEFVLKKLEEQGGVDHWDEQVKKQVHALTKQGVDRYVQDELGGMEHQTERFRYLFRRLLRSVYSVMDNVVQELADSKFAPISFELGFARDGELPPVELSANGVTLSVSGFVDRVDGWVHDGRLYLRVVDYKTGRKSFDLTEIWNGLGLQMLLYLFTLKERGEGLYGLPVENAGVLYLPARELIVKGSRSMTEEQRQKVVDKELVRRGLILDDPDVLSAMENCKNGSYRFLPLRVTKSTGQISGEALVSAQRLGRLQKHIQHVLEDICKEMAAGNITADPFWRGAEKNACRFCEYASACHFEEGRGGDCRRWAATISPSRFWEQLEDEVERG